MLTLRFRLDDTGVQFEFLAGVTTALDRFQATAEGLNIAHSDVRTQLAGSHDRICQIEERLQRTENRPIAPVDTRV